MRFLTLSFLLSFVSGLFAQNYQVIHTRKEVVADTFFQTHVVTDPYRWLEKTEVSEVKSWAKRQDQMADEWLKKTRRNTNSNSKIDRYRKADLNYSRKAGNYFFSFAYTDNRVNASLLINTTTNKNTREILINPYNDVSRKDRIDIQDYSVSKDSRHLAYQYTRNGSDWCECGVVMLPSGKQLDDQLKGLKFSSIAWKDEGFFYSVFPRGLKYSPTYGQKVHFHKLGEPQHKDELIFERKKKPWISFDFITSSNERFFVLTETDEVNGRVNAFYIDYQSEIRALRPLVTNFDHRITFLDSHDGKLIAIKGSNAGNKQVVEIDPANPLRWREVVPPFSKGALVEAVPFNDRIVGILQENNHPVLLVMDYSGNLLHKARFPMVCSISGLREGYEDGKIHFVLSSYTVPPVVYEFDIKTYEKKPVDRTGVAFDFDGIQYDQIEYTSLDGTKIPMVLVYKGQLKRDRSNPVLLSAYGGFGVVHKPSFNPGIVHFIENGGIYAYANIRGGGDKGYEWANAGRGANKQTSFDDFIAAAEYLISKDYISSDLLAATGTSNGGLVVATAAIQRPDLFKAVIPVVAPTDMLRFEKFTVGPWHRDEYGTVLDSASFCRLKSYSPYHNIKDSVDYPSMLVVTSENDDRVPPLHSYKFVARLQNRAAQRNPILLKVEENAGHYGASSLKLKIRELADQFSFVFHELDMDQ